MHRIAALPRRRWQDLAPETVQPLTDLLKTRDGKQTLFDIQAVALREDCEQGGSFTMGATGVGKTLTAGLMGGWMQEERVLMLVDSGAKAKTEREFDEYRVNWQITPRQNYKLFGYHDISRFPSQGMSISKLWGGRGPQRIILDEAQKVRRVYLDKQASGIARQIADHMNEFPECKMTALTATPDKSSIKDYAHILEWCLGEGSPLPTNYPDLCDWSDVIDKGDMRAAKKVCLQLGIPPTEDLDKIREAFRARLAETPGVIISDAGFDGPLKFHTFTVQHPAEMLPHYHQLMTLWQRPDGFDLSPEDPADKKEPDRITAGSVWAVQRQESLGFCYVPDPKPPQEWAEARRNYFAMVRRLIRKQLYYTEFQVRQGAAAGELSPRDQHIWEKWEELRPTFEPSFKPLWLSNFAIDLAMEWGRKAPGLIWVDHVAFGEELEKQSEWFYYRENGLNRHKQPIDLAPGDVTAIISGPANSTSRNLQQFNRNLYMACPPNNLIFEQRTGRTHRQGQLNPVTVDIYIGCAAHQDSVDNVLDDAQRQSQTLYKQKAMAFEWTSSGPEPKGAIYGV